MIICVTMLPISKLATFFLVGWMLLCGTASLSQEHPCNSNIYCYGELLHTVEMAHIYPDSKTFVDMKLRYSSQQVWKNFNTLIIHHNKPSKEQIKKFVEENFEKRGSELEIWKPDDWHEHPHFLSNISDSKYRKWAKQIHDIWKELGRKIKQEVKEHEDRYSIIYVPYPAIVPGGRFLEFYYWDSYWIVKGLLVSEMPNTVRGMLENFLYMVEKLGFIPNGGRVYYENRSQPPLLIPMMESYVEFTEDKSFLQEHLDTLEKEFQFWMNNRTINLILGGKTYNLARYFVDAGGPRPESYREDFLLAENLTSKERDLLYANLKSGAESGWDFSSRWFINENDTSEGTLADVKTRDIIPVDLNAFLCRNAHLLAKWFRELGNTIKAAEYENYANGLKEAIEKVLWNEEDGIWYDYDILNNKSRIYFYPTNVIPLWANCYDETRKEDIVNKVLMYLRKSNSLQYPGGVPTSLQATHQQWDFPNAWPPLQHLMVVGLDETGVAEAQKLAFELAAKWTKSNYMAFQESNHSMFEKYDATTLGLPGGGGEYDVQLGFGWSNGVILDFLHKYGKQFTSDSVSAGVSTSSTVLGPIALGGVFIAMASLLG